MEKIVIAEVHPSLDGEYELDASGFTNFELHAIKRLTGLTAGDLGDAFERLDNDVIVAMGMVVLLRDGKIQNAKHPWDSQEIEALWKAPVGSLTIASDEEEVDASPPTPEPLADAGEKNGSSGESSRLASVPPEPDRSRIGEPT